MDKTDSHLSNTFALTTRLKRSGLIKFVTRFVSYKFLKHYLYPTVAGRNAKPYDMGRFFESWYRSHLPQEFSDGITISPEYDPLAARFHYNATENSIIRHFARNPAPENNVLILTKAGAA